MKKRERHSQSMCVCVCDRKLIVCLFTMELSQCELTCPQSPRDPALPSPSLDTKPAFKKAVDAVPLPLLPSAAVTKQSHMPVFSLHIPRPEQGSFSLVPFCASTMTIEPETGSASTFSKGISPNSDRNSILTTRVAVPRPQSRPVLSHTEVLASTSTFNLRSVSAGESSVQRPVTATSPMDTRDSRACSRFARLVELHSRVLVV
mmetsp:Transcript_49998/g.64050  ORF Transcript_49998/g.64050 Transcript_49998/m.64050 type:complete len:204 (-) Transcript_49998:3473-4084(-)